MPRAVRMSAQPARSNGAGRRPSAPTLEVNGAELASAEITTDFLPLMHGGGLAPGDGGQLIRVELPRSALVSLAADTWARGTTLQARCSSVKTGMARAIRFVR